MPWGVEALSGAISDPAWKHRPSWYLLVTDDKMIPIAAQRLMAKRAGSTVVEVGGSHAIYVSNPKAVAGIIVTAAKAAQGEKRAGFLLPVVFICSATYERSAMSALISG